MFMFFLQAERQFRLQSDSVHAQQVQPDSLERAKHALAVDRWAARLHLLGHQGIAAEART